MAMLSLVQPPDAAHEPPHADRAERAVLSAVIADPTAMNRVADFLRPRHFFFERHAKIFEACTELHRANQAIDPTTIAEWLRDRKRLEQVGFDYIADTIASSPAFGNVRDHALIVHGKWRARLVMQAADRVRLAGYGDYGDVQDYCDRAAKAMLDIARDTVVGRAESTAEALRRIAAEMTPSEEQRAAKSQRGIPTGLFSFDRLMNGIQPGRKLTIAALPGVGKTAFAMQLAWAVAERGVGVLMWSTEMTRDELVEREISRRGRIPFERVRTRSLEAEDWPRFTQAASRMAELPVIIDDTADIHIGQIQSATQGYADKLRADFKVPLGLVIIDYIQNLAVAPEASHKPTHEQVKHSTVEFARMLKRTGLAGIELAQRKPVPIDPKTKLRPKPTKGCVADSHWIERSTHGLAFLHRNPRYAVNGVVIGEDPTSIQFILAKQRGGREHDFELRFEGQFSSFTDPNAPGGAPSRQYVDDSLEDDR